MHPVLRNLLVSLSLMGVVPATAGTTPPVTSSPSPHVISIKDSPGYKPLTDRDSLTEVLGRRPDAKRVKLPFGGGTRSLDDMGRAVCRALHEGSPDSLKALCISMDEFRFVLWPEFPQSRPATGLHWQDAWPVLYGRLNGGSVGATREFEGHVYQFERIERTAETKEYRNFKLHNGITIVAKDDEGQTHRITFIRSIAERKGRFKIYSMRD